MTFEKTKFDNLQKIVNRFKKINSETFEETLKDTERFDLTRVIDEVTKNILELNCDLTETTLLIKVSCALNTIYEQFNPILKAELNKMLKNTLQDKTEHTSFEAEDKAILRKKKVLRFYFEAHIYGLMPDFKPIHATIIGLMTEKTNITLNFTLVTDILKTFGEVIFTIRPKLITKLIEVYF